MKERISPGVIRLLRLDSLAGSLRVPCALIISLGAAASSAFGDNYSYSGNIVTQTISPAGFYSISATGAAGGSGGAAVGKGATASVRTTGETARVARRSRSGLSPRAPSSATPRCKTRTRLPSRGAPVRHREPIRPPRRTRSRE